MTGSLSRRLIAGSVLAVVVLTGLLLARRSLVIVTVEYDSMSPALLDGDRVLAVRSWPTRWLRHGNIVIVWPWSIPEGSRYPLDVEAPFIKRIIGMPGTTVRVGDASAPGESSGAVAGAQRAWHIPAEHYFVRGDNPASYHDSTRWGPVHASGILGLVVMKLPRRVAAANPTAAGPS